MVAGFIKKFIGVRHRDPPAPPPLNGNLTHEVLLKQVDRINICIAEYVAHHSDPSKANTKFPEKYAVHLRPLFEQVEKFEGKGVSGILAEASARFMKLVYSERAEIPELWPDERVNEASNTIAEITGTDPQYVKKHLVKTQDEVSGRDGSHDGGADSAAYEFTSRALDVGGQKHLKSNFDRLMALTEPFFDPKDHQFSVASKAVFDRLFGHHTAKSDPSKSSRP